MDQRENRVLRFVIALAIACVASCAKENNVTQSTDVSGVGNPCGADKAPCLAGTTCILGFCRLPCDHDDDCEGDSVCIGDDAFGCSATHELACSSSQKCTAPLACDPNGAVGACRNACSTAADCKLPNYDCVGSVCVPKR